MTAPAGAMTAGDGSRRYPVQGRQLPSANTVLSALDKPGLNVWKLKKVAAAIAADEILASMARAGEEYKAVRSALDHGPNPEAELGTAVHWWTEELDRGHSLNGMPEEVAPFVDQYRSTCLEFSLHPAAIERTVASLDPEYAGTFDRLMACSDREVRDMIHPGCGLLHVADIKTGKAVWPDVALQLAAYAHAPYIWTADQDLLEPKPETCTIMGIVLSLHADECRVVPVHIAPAWPTFLAALRA